MNTIDLTREISKCDNMKDLVAVREKLIDPLPEGQQKQDVMRTYTLRWGALLR